MRRRLLEEMGLGPLWRVRRAPDALDSASPAVPDRSSSPAPTDQQRRAAGISAMEWESLRTSVSGCVACRLCEGRRNTVFGVGDPRGAVMFVGEAPGQEEDARGEPFVGQAGRLLDNMLGAVGMRRDSDVYIANVLKCRPPNNRNPEPLEVEQCSPYLLRQIALVQPRLIVAMGRFAAQTLLATDASIASLRGRLFRYRDIALMVTYHPAYLLRTLQDKAKAWEDLVFMRRELERLKSEPEQRENQRVPDH